LVVFEFFKSDVTFRTAKLSRSIHLGSRAWLLLISFCFFCLFLSKKVKIFYYVPVWFKLQTSDYLCYARTTRARKQSCSDLDIKSICSVSKKNSKFVWIISSSKFVRFSARG
jgi:hypothetical protein